jgi:pyruvate formate lyase activating enzyme
LPPGTGDEILTMTQNMEPDMAIIVTTPQEVLIRAREIGLKTGLHYVYLGNLSNTENEDTRCPDCGQILIERRNFGILQNNIQDGHCPMCGREIAGEGMSYDRNRKVC